uniref:Uncharacterized protein n=1 Tax=Romanomermis culicivorax TaxID=13658 RepID=A0A915L799_ROMCU
MCHRESVNFEAVAESQRTHSEIEKSEESLLLFNGSISFEIPIKILRLANKLNAWKIQITFARNL